MRPSYIILTLTLLLFGGVACQEEESNKRSDRSQDRTFPVRAIVLDPVSFARDFNSTGTFEPYEQVMISPEIAGRIDKIYFSEGEFVKKGQLLLSINADDIKAEASQIKTSLNNAISKADRGKSLEKIDAISKEELEDLLFEVENLKNELAENQVRFNKTQIRAPFSGLTGFRNYSPGAYVNPGDGIVELVQQDPLKVQFELPQKFADQIRVGDSITIEYGSNLKFDLPIDAISSRIEQTNRSFAIQTRIDNKDRKILPGSFARINVPFYQTDSALLVPTEAVIKTIEKEEVFIVKNGKAQKVKVETGIRNETAVEIQAGCKRGDTVIITGLLSLSEGNKVKTTVINWENLGQ